MGHFLSQPSTAKETCAGEGLGIRFGLSFMQGWRPHMEDAHQVSLKLKHGFEDWSYFAVFDGHAGNFAAKYASHHLLEFILMEFQRKLHPDEESESEETDDEAIAKVPGLLLCDPYPDGKELPIDETSQFDTQGWHSDNGAKFHSHPVEEQVALAREAISSAFLKFDKHLRIKCHPTSNISGCTVVCAFTSPTHIFIANCGDSRAVLFDKDGSRFATEDHKPLNPNERTRIINAGGTATERINGTLAVSRALGDFNFKDDRRRGPCDQLVSPEPEITIIERRPTDEFLVLACDGIWDVLNNHDLGTYVRYLLKVEPNIETICSTVLDLCLRKGSRDNMSIIIILFENAPKFDPELVKEVEKNDQIILEQFDKIQLPIHLRFQSLTTALWQLEKTIDQELFPPGVGILGKYDMLSKRFDENLLKIRDTTA